jgi:hypothetical protein
MMTTAEVLASPVIVSAIIAAAVALVTKVIDTHLKRTKLRDDNRVNDRELLSKDEKDFRLSIIKQLQQCTDLQRTIQRENLTLLQNEVRLTVRITRLELEIGMMEDVLRAKNIPLPFTRHADDATHP